MALFNFLKGLTASERKEFDDLKKEVESLRKSIPAQVNLTGYAKTSDIPDVSGFAKSSDIKAPDLSKYALKDQIPDVSKFITSIPDSANYWKNQNEKHPVKKATLFLTDTKPTTAPDSQITIVV